jgi:hypothetical protein
MDKVRMRRGSIEVLHVSSLGGSLLRSNGRKKLVEIVDGERIKKYHTDRCFSHQRFLVCKHLIHCCEPIANRFFEQRRMTTLVQEAFDRAHNNGLTISPALGTCVRYAKVAATAQNVASQRCVIWNLHLSDHEALKREKEARDSYYITYIPFVRIAIANALPNLRFLEWTDELTLSLLLFKPYQKLDTAAS